MIDAAPDLEIRTGSVAWTPALPTMVWLVHFQLMLHNLGPQTAGSVSVSLFDQVSGALLDSVQTFVAANDSTPPTYALFDDVYKGEYPQVLVYYDVIGQLFCFVRCL